MSRADIHARSLVFDQSRHYEEKLIMRQTPSGHALDGQQQNPAISAEQIGEAKSALTRLATWISDRNFAFGIVSGGMIVMLLWAGSFKMTAAGAGTIAPLVYHSPLIWWHFKLFGPYIGSDIIGLTEITAALLFIAGYFKPKAGIIGSFITVVMFFTTSTMLVSTPGTTITLPGIPWMRYMDMLGLFLFKDIISLGASFYLISSFGKRAILLENKT